MGKNNDIDMEGCMNSKGCEIMGGCLMFVAIAIVALLVLGAMALGLL